MFNYTVSHDAIAYVRKEVRLLDEDTKQNVQRLWDKVEDVRVNVSDVNEKVTGLVVAEKYTRTDMKDIKKILTSLTSKLLEVNNGD